MKPAAGDHWHRALRAQQSAQLLVDAADYDGAASRAYYAAFHAFSALFASEDRTFVKHSQLEAAVHRDLVREGRMEAAVGKASPPFASTARAGTMAGSST